MFPYSYGTSALSPFGYHAEDFANRRKQRRNRTTFTAHQVHNYMLIMFVHDE